MTINHKEIMSIKILIHLAALFVLLYLALLIEQGSLGADPVKELIHFVGKTAMNFLLITLAITPLAKRFKQPLLIQLRRVLGLYSFAWACVHLLAFVYLELNWQLALFVDEVIKRPYMTVGALAWIILLLLSITSVTFIRKKMKRAWLTLHRFVYWAALLVVIHYYWSVKSGLIEPAIYIAICLFLLAQRKEYFKKLLHI
ncbi:protein-methionine-sulfoxide reductase heme-binding subunit MsrQ [Psychromonas sp. MME1]|uniref:protein-methionine-sulfoxide reductase heme-binding subunit MsrQ n=1 Tax=Psychromonas sp. MME1 TaxID=3231032 RepID=UPI0034E2AF8D